MGIVDLLIALIGRLIGFDYHKGIRVHSLSYWQTLSQHYNPHLLAGGDGLQSYHDKKGAIEVRKSVVDWLKRQGLSDFKVALVLNTTEYEVQQLRHSA